MKHIARADLDAMPQRVRASLVNSLSGFKSAMLVGTCDLHRATNLSIVSSVVHLGSDPPLLAFVVRPPLVPRHTYDNILATGVYTFNHVHVGIVEQAHQSSARYPREVSEFDAVGLLAGWREGFAAPVVVDAVLTIGMELVRDVAIEENGTRLIIGQVAWIDLPGDALHDDGYIDIERAGTVAISGLDSYHRTQRLVRLPYAKPNTPP